jgi:hypothetical protein
MGRWGKGIYQSDAALDYFSTISDYFERELAYWFAPEHVSRSSLWLSEAIAPIEVVLLFRQNHIGSIVFEETKAVERWRNVFLNVWDSEWKSERYLTTESHDIAYRQQHRSGIVGIFNQLETVAQFWTTIRENDHILKLPSLPPDYDLPYFSKYPGRIIERLVKDIIYYLSAEMRPDALGFFRVHEDLPVAIDVLGLLCNSYKTDPIINAKTVGKWRTITLEIFDQTEEEYGIKDDTEHYNNVMAAFDRLEIVAQKYPPVDWLDNE